MGSRPALSSLAADTPPMWALAAARPWGPRARLAYSPGSSRSSCFPALAAWAPPPSANRLPRAEGSTPGACVVVARLVARRCVVTQSSAKLLRVRGRALAMGRPLLSLWLPPPRRSLTPSLPPTSPSQRYTGAPMPPNGKSALAKLGRPVIAMTATLAQGPSARGPLGMAAADPTQGGAPVLYTLAPLSMLMGTMLEFHMACSLAAARPATVPL